MSVAPQLEFRILGPLDVRDHGHLVELRRHKQRALLAILLLHANEWLSADALIEALWGERPPRTARAALQGYIAQLRRTLGRELIVSREGGYRLEIDPEQLDLGRFARLVGQARTADGEDRVANLEEAAELWRGPALADLLYEPFADQEAERLEEQHVAALEELADAELLLGEGPALVERLETLVAEHPYRERLRGQQMLALYRDGRQVEALDCYRKARATLVEELGIEPGAALRELEQAILRQDPSLRPRAREELPPLAERRKAVTVLFAELLLPDQLDPELERAQCVQALARVRAVLETHGASIEQRASEELLAVFGVPIAHEDDALRAARAALELRAALPGALRLAIESGEVLAGVDAAGHGFVSGALVPAGRHLLERADKGEVLVGEGALQLLGERALTEPKDRGRARRLAAIAELTLGATPPESPLADRRDELAALRRHFEQVVEQGRGRLVLLLGEAGIGKTRLAAELASQLEGGAAIARGRCLSYGRGLTYWPLVEALRDLGEPAAEALERLVEGGATSPRQLAWTVGQALERSAAERPLLLLLEDLHWAEPALLELLAELEPEAPTLLLALARPELLERHPGSEAAEQIRLGPLRRRDCRALLSALPRPPEADEQEPVLARAGGNPLFLEELSAFLAAGGEAARLPPRLHVLLQARLDLLTEPERLLLSCAALEGTRFHQGALEALLPDVDVAARLPTLTRTLLIRPVSGAVEGERGYRFRHQLIRDAAYDALPKAERARLHERFADWLAEHLGSRAELADVVAYHLEQAALARRELRAADTSLEHRAAEGLAAAAERAGRRADYPAAVELWRRSLALLADDDPSVPGAELELGVVLAALGAFAEAKELLAGAERRASDPCLSGHIRIARLNAEMNFEPEGMDAAIRSECERVVPLFEEHGDHRALSRAWYALGQVEWAETRMRAADAALETAAAHAHRAGDPALEVLMLASRAGWLGTTCWPSSKTRRELERLTARFPGEPVAERMLRFWRVFSAYQEGRPDDARALAAEWLDDVRRHDSPMMAESYAMFFALNELLTGDVERAERLALDAVEALEDCGVRAFLGSAKSVLAEVRAAQGRAREAVELAEESVRIGSPSDRINLVAAHAVQARAYSMLSEHEQAKAAAAEAVAVAGQTDSLVIRATAQKALAQALLAAGELPAAHAAGVEAVRLFGTLERFLSQQAAAALVDQIERELAAGERRHERRPKSRRGLT